MPLPIVGINEIAASEHAQIVRGLGRQLLVPAVAFIGQQHRLQMHRHRYARVGLPDLGTQFGEMTGDTP